jgi:glycosyltransferase involved in cell wall biosynthesis
MNPLVSILIPAHNAAHWIGDTLQSAIGQTWQRKEIIVVDDGSTDGTIEAARCYEWAGVRVIGSENQGAARARNHALALCQGDYIQWLDADDLLASDKIQKQIESCDGNRRTLLSSAFGRFHYRTKCAKFKPSPLWCDLSPAEWLVRRMGQNLYMQTATWLVSRELTESAGVWDPELTLDDDGEYFGRVVLASNHVQFVHNSKVYYRVAGSQSLSHVRRSDKKLNSQWRSMELQVRQLRSLGESVAVREAGIRYLQNFQSLFYPERMDVVHWAEQIARELGGELIPPRLSWKYSWIGSVLGRPTAERARLLLPSLRWRAVGYLDRAMFLALKLHHHFHGVYLRSKRLRNE